MKYRCIGCKTEFNDLLDIMQHLIDKDLIEIVEDIKVPEYKDKKK